jgi:hypothetical protein
LHHDGIYPSTYVTNPLLAKNIDLLSTNLDRKGTPFGSSLEHKTAPIYGVQFHPERNAVRTISISVLTSYSLNGIFKKPPLTQQMPSEPHSIWQLSSSTKLEKTAITSKLQKKKAKP